MPRYRSKFTQFFSDNPPKISKLSKWHFKLLLFCMTKKKKLQTWMYLAIPLALYACERLLRAFRSGYKTVRIQKVHF